jgi:hypothetical protein
MRAWLRRRCALSMGKPSQPSSTDGFQSDSRRTGPQRQILPDGVWFTMLLNRHGDRILRVKGILDIVGSPQPRFALTGCDI